MRRTARAPNARAELEEAREHLREIDPALYAALVWKAVKASRHLLEQPLAGVRVGGRDTRKWRVAGTPHLLLYRADAQEVEILHVAYAAGDWTNFL